MPRISPQLVLASSSPQRRAILERLGVSFTVRPLIALEIEQGDPGEVALENALRKARVAQKLGIEAGGVRRWCSAATRWWRSRAHLWQAPRRARGPRDAAGAEWRNT